MSAVHYPGEAVYRTTEDTIDKKGRILTLEGIGTAGYVKLADLAGETPYGIALKTTKNPITEDYDKTVPIAIQIDGIAQVLIDDTNAVITVGDMLAVTANATADKFTFAGATVSVAELKKLVGMAEEAVALTTGGLCKVRLAKLVMGP